MNNPNITRRAKLFAAFYRADQATKRAREAFEKFTGSRGLCWSGHDETTVSIEIPLAQYLTEFPSAKPEYHQYHSDSERVDKAYLSYPLQYAGEFGGIKVWVKGETPVVAIQETALTAAVDVAMTVAAQAA